MINKEKILRKRLISVYKESAPDMVPFAIDGSSSIGFRFVLDSRSRLVSIMSPCPSYSDNIGTVNFAIYKWLGNFDDTVSEKTLFSETFVDFADNAFLESVTADKNITDGEFLFLCDKGKDGVGMWCGLLPDESEPKKSKYGIELFTNGMKGGNAMPRSILCIEQEEFIGEDRIAEAFASDYVRNEWLIPAVPSYDYGVLSENLYNCGQGVYLEKEYSSENDSLLAAATETNAAEYKKYIEKLVANGYSEEYHNEVDFNIYDTYFNGKNRIYSYYTDAYKTVRIVLDKTSSCLNDFGYKYEKKPGDTTEVYQYGIKMATSFNPDPTYLEYIGGGMEYVIKLADNSIFMIDGGMFTQYDSAHCDEFMAFLRKITNTGENDKVRISCWHITHGHDDHNSGFAYFMKKYHDNLTVERLMYNLPDEYNECTALVGNCEYNQGAFECIRRYWPNVLELKIHTGEKISLADIEIEILFTHEDLIDTKTGKSIASDFNSTSTVSKINFDGKSLIITGDATPQGEKFIVESFSQETIKADMVQASHHMINPLTVFYRISEPEIFLIPQNSVHITDYPPVHYLHDSIIDNFPRHYYGGDETVGFKVENGKIVDFHHGRIVGGRYTGWDF